MIRIAYECLAHAPRTTLAFSSILNKIEGADIHSVQGKHPAGNVGVQIASINPVNQGEHVWTVNAQDLVTIGRLFVDGVYGIRHSHTRWPRRSRGRGRHLQAGFMKNLFQYHHG